MNPDRLRQCTALCVTALLGAVLPVLGQVDVALSTRYTKYLRYEPVEVILRVRNYSGNTLVFGGETSENRGYLRFVIESHRSLTVPALDRNANPVADLILEPMRTKELKLMLNALYDLREDGAYTITARVGHRRLSHDFESNPVTIEIQDGAVVAKRSVGLPTTDETAVIESVTASLVLLHDTRSATYCLRVEDDSFVYATVRLGAAVTTTEAQLDADAASMVHVLFQTRPRLFKYVVYNLSGKNVRLMQQQFFVPEGSVPRLVQRPGHLAVAGGRRAIEGVDYELAEGHVRTPR